MNSNLNFIGKNIRFFRRERNWTLAALASKIGIREGPLGRIERGMNLPSAGVLYNLTMALDVSADALFAHDLASARAVAADTDSLLVTIDPEPIIPPKNILIACYEIMTAFHALEDILHVQKHACIPLSIPFEPDYPGMEQLSYRMRSYFDIRDAVVFDYLELFENSGLRIILFPFMKTASEIDALSFYEPLFHNSFFFINSRNTHEKQLFALARELGKILIFNQMRSQKNTIFPPENPENESRPITENRAASRFAATFLMPQSAVQATIKQLGIDQNAWSWDLLLRIKHRFGISTESFLYRLDELGLISGKLVREFQSRIETYYTQTGFSEPDSSRRILNANGRFFDLLMSAEGIDSAREEVNEIKSLVKKVKLEKN